VANGLAAGQYFAPTFEFIFPENVKPGDLLIPFDFWHLPFLRFGEGATTASPIGPGVGPLEPTPWSGVPVTVPGAPTIGVATAGNATASVAWTPPASDGGAAITGYVVTALDSAGNPAGTVTVAGNITSATVTGLTNGQTYRLKVAASNLLGVGAFSALSNAVTPAATTPAAPAAPTAVAGNASVTLSWAPPPSDGGSAVTGYEVLVSTGTTVVSTITAIPAADTSRVITGLADATAYTFQVRAVNAVGAGALSPPSNQVTVRSLVGFTGMTPTRILDTRTGLGLGALGTVGTPAALGVGAATTLTVLGVPVGATAVALNVTVTNPTASSFLTVYPGGTARPTASNLNYTPGQTVPNMVLVPLGPGNTITIYNEAGTVDVIADLVGSYAPGAGAAFAATSPTRVLDTRTGLGAPTALGAGATMTLTVPGLPVGATAVALNVTVTNPTAASWLTVYPGGTALPTTSNLNFTPGQTVPNMVIVPLGPGNTVTIYNQAGTVDVIADLVGSYAPTGAGFTGTSPTRVLDTRTGLGQTPATPATLGAGTTMTLTVPGLPAGTTAVALNVTVTNPTAFSWLTVYPGGAPLRPTASNLNYAPGQTVPNLVLVPVGPGNTVTFYNNAGAVDVIADLVGYFN
uniref:fibronectin type III domain-containing protein n=1 Tax=Lapillicoccus sp. TaxID=1909287 RepID=UPI003983B98B